MYGQGARAQESKGTGRREQGQESAHLWEPGRAHVKERGEMAGGREGGEVGEGGRERKE